MPEKVQGRCPACGSESLFLGKNGYVTCGVLGCKDPCAADKVLNGEQPPERILVVEVRCTPGWDVAEAKARIASGIGRLLTNAQADGTLHPTRGFSVGTSIEEGAACSAKTERRRPMDDASDAYLAALDEVMAERDRYRQALAWAVDWIERIAEVPVPGTDEQEDWERFAAAKELLRASNQKREPQEGS